MNLENPENNIEMIEGLPVHTLKDGTKLLIVSPERELKFSDDTSIENNIDNETRKLIKINRSYLKESEKSSVKSFETKKGISNELLNILRNVSDKVNLVLVSPEFIQTLEQLGLRDEFPNVLAYNPTFETADKPSSEMVIEAGRWSY